MTKQTNKGTSSVSKDASTNWDDAPAPGSRNPDPSKTNVDPKPANPALAEPTDKVDPDAVKATLDTAAAKLPVDPKSEQVAERLNELAGARRHSAKSGLVEAFKQVALVVGADKAKRILAEQYGASEPEELKASQLMDAIDDLYGAA